MLVSLLDAPSGGVWSVFVLIGVGARLLGEMAELGCRWGATLGDAVDARQLSAQTLAKYAHVHCTHMNAWLNMHVLASWQQFSCRGSSLAGVIEANMTRMPLLLGDSRVAPAGRVSRASILTLDLLEALPLHLAAATRRKLELL